jgi:hypothetical protein
MVKRIIIVLLETTARAGAGFRGDPSKTQWNLAKTWQTRRRTR